MGGLSRTQKRRRNAGDDKRGRLGDGRRQHSGKKKMSGVKKRGVKGGGIKEKSVGAQHTEKMTRGGREGRHGRRDGLSFIRIFWEHGLSAAGCFI